MTRDDFRIGTEFACDGKVWRCTDVGTRVIVAIRVDSALVGSNAHPPRPLNRLEAEANGWFLGPPYAVAEVVFDEDDQAACCPAGNA